MILVLPFYFLVKLAKFVIQLILGYDAFDNKKEGSYLRGKSEGLRISILMLLILSTISYLPYYFWNRGLSWDEGGVVSWIVSLISGILMLAIYYTGFIFAFIIIDSIVQYFKYWGLPDQKKIKKICRLRFLSDRFNGYMCVIVLPLFVLLVPACGLALSAKPSIMGFIFVISLLSLYVIINFFVPPALLFLSTSRENKMILQAKLNRTSVRPIASLLNKNDPVVQKISSFDSTNIFRTIDGNRWTESVEALMQICPVLVMDTRDITDPVLLEANILFSNGLDHKTLFVVREDGAHPVLDHYFSSLPQSEVNTVLSQIQDRLFKESELLEILRGDVRKLKSLISEARTPAECQIPGKRVC